MFGDVPQASTVSVYVLVLCHGEGRRQWASTANERRSSALLEYVTENEI